ncbi:hypothetical protein [Amycolatopsis saalfeldensis]|uniref:Uncharacterized protein n=1 Tax=Amycolatopsis saalfeldensis TaxID=394193 RepID=A0A1H8RDQ2_9PSEU|nr:hypothetical protein [Amycolatopsis saalfeldensis]SEO64153.1 hypothetical protein SAMN04489732_101733 [Amycolatopsis saalfeldensis]
MDGPYPPGYRLIRWLTGRMFTASLTDPRTDDRLSRIINMLAHPNSLAAPAAVARALWVTRGRSSKPAA